MLSIRFVFCKCYEDKFMVLSTNIRSNANEHFLTKRNGKLAFTHTHVYIHEFRAYAFVSFVYICLSEIIIL